MIQFTGLIHPKDVGDLIGRLEGLRIAELGFRAARGGTIKNGKAVSTQVPDGTATEHVLKHIRLHKLVELGVADVRSILQGTAWKASGANVVIKTLKHHKVLGKKSKGKYGKYKIVNKGA